MTGEKLTGYAWFKSIGSPKHIVAPMVEQSDLAFRLLTRDHGAHMCYTQMLNVPTFLTSKEYREGHLQSIPSERPLIVQIAGHNPEEMLRACKIIQGRVACDAFDVNLGCPQGIAKRGHYGAFLMEHHELLTEIVSTLANGLSIPVTCKTRIYEDYERSVELCEVLVNAGASLLTIHGRTRESKGEWTGAADWDMITKLRKRFHGIVPMFANGGISSLDDVNRCIEYTKCDGVMSSEAILENPAIFNKEQNHNQIELAEKYLQKARLHPPRLLRTVRAHLMKLLYRYIQYPTLLHYREQIHECKTMEDYEALVQELKINITDHEPYSKPGLTWYTRHLNTDRNHAGLRSKGKDAQYNEKQVLLAEDAWSKFDDTECSIFASLGLGGEEE